MHTVLRRVWRWLIDKELHMSDENEPAAAPEETAAPETVAEIVKEDALAVLAEVRAALKAGGANIAAVVERFATLSPEHVALAERIAADIAAVPAEAREIVFGVSGMEPEFIAALKRVGALEEKGRKAITAFVSAEI